MIYKLMPLISVIVITYNHESYIRQSMSSIWIQKINVPIEILVGNDASVDKTGEILDELNRKMPFSLYHRKKNIGASANLYDLLKHAKGKYIAFLEGDDYWTDAQKLQKQFDFLQHHPEYIACTHECILVDENGLPLSNQKLKWISKKRKFGIKESQGFYLAGQIGTLMCRNIFKNSNENFSIIYTAHPMISDRTVQMVLALNGYIYRLNNYMGAYRQICETDKENATSKYFVENIHSAYDNFMLTCKLEGFAQDYLRDYSIDFFFIKLLFFTSAMYHRFRENSPEIRQDIKNILRYPGVKKWKYYLFLPIGIIFKLLHKWN